MNNYSLYTISLFLTLSTLLYTSCSQTPKTDSKIQIEKQEITSAKKNDPAPPVPPLAQV